MAVKTRCPPLIYSRDMKGKINPIWCFGFLILCFWDSFASPPRVSGSVAWPNFYLSHNQDLLVSLQTNLYMTGSSAHSYDERVQRALEEHQWPVLYLFDGEKRTLVHGWGEEENGTHLFAPYSNDGKAVKYVDIIVERDMSLYILGEWFRIVPHTVLEIENMRGQLITDRTSSDYRHTQHYNQYFIRKLGPDGRSDPNFGEDGIIWLSDLDYHPLILRDKTSFSVIQKYPFLMGFKRIKNSFLVAFSDERVTELIPFTSEGRRDAYINGGQSILLPASIDPITIFDSHKQNNIRAVIRNKETGKFEAYEIPVYGSYCSPKRILEAENPITSQTHLGWSFRPPNTFQRLSRTGGAFAVNSVQFRAEKPNIKSSDMDIVRYDFENNDTYRMSLRPHTTRSPDGNIVVFLKQRHILSERTFPHGKPVGNPRFTNGLFDEMTIGEGCRDIYGRVARQAELWGIQNL